MRHASFSRVILTALVLAVSTVAVSMVAVSMVCAKEPWIIDTHTHFKGAAQVALEAKQKVRNPKDTLGHVVVVEDYRRVAKRLAIEATVIVEAVDQQQPQFNDWVLEQAKSELACAYVARGDLNSSQFADNYERYRKTGLLVGYRFRFDELRGYLNHELGRQNLKRLEDDGMVVDLLIEFSHAADVVQLAERYPQLKIVINHCFRARMTDGKIGDEWRKAIADCSKSPNVFCKLSSIVNFADVEAFGKPAPKDLAAYLPVLEPCYEAFGEDRLIFGTNWGVCNHFGSVDDVVRLATEFVEPKSKTALRKIMRDNALRVYGIKL